MYIITPIHFLVTNQIITGREAVAKGQHGLAVFNDDAMHVLRFLKASFQFPTDQDELNFRRDIDGIYSEEELKTILSNYKQFLITDEKIKELTGETEFDTMIKALVKKIEGKTNEGFSSSVFAYAQDAASQFFIENKEKIKELLSA